MKLARIVGPATVCKCSGCKVEGIGGSHTYRSASTGERRAPAAWYTKGCDENYCNKCAAKLVEADSTRSRSRFFTDTKGSEIDPEIVQL